MYLGEWKSKDEEKRKLKIHLSVVERSLQKQKEVRAELEKENQALKKQLQEIQKENKKLSENNRELEKQRDKYRDMVFKPNKKNQDQASLESNARTDFPLPNKKKKRGGQKGHKGHGREKPEKIDEYKCHHLTNCPICGKKLERSENTDDHTVEDIPAVEEIKAKITCHKVEKQWCKHCHKEVKAIASGVIPGSRLGINLIIYVMQAKYGARMSWDIVVETLKSIYGVTVSKGGLINILHKVRDSLGKEYERIIEEIRGSPVKYGDETSWRVNGQNWWAWGAFTDKNTYYAIRESRGKGVAEKLFAGSHKEDVLVRDDYGAYTKLPLKQQSCWSHLLRVSHETVSVENSSQEMRKFHEKLKGMFADLKKIIELPFKKSERKKLYTEYEKKIEKIIKKKYKHGDAQKIQTRIANQSTNLITALLYKGVPLTNNLAERRIRPLVVTRKISGGSRSREGATTHAVNFSVFQNLRYQQQDGYLAQLKNLILESSRRN